MAKKPQTFRIIPEDKIIVIYTNCTEQEKQAEKELRLFYLNAGYQVKLEEKKKGKSVDEMRAELKKKDEAALKEFNRIYELKLTKDKEEDKERGFFGACKYYNEWKKKWKEEHADK